jgi:hypothetical protein
VCLLARRRELLRWTTAVNVKLLLPPRQSRGTSLGGLARRKFWRCVSFGEPPSPVRGNLDGRCGGIAEFAAVFRSTRPPFSSMRRRRRSSSGSCRRTPRGRPDPHHRSEHHRGRSACPRSNISGPLGAFRIEWPRGHFQLLERGQYGSIFPRPTISGVLAIA